MGFDGGRKAKLEGGRGTAMFSLFQEPFTPRAFSSPLVSSLGSLAALKSQGCTVETYTQIHIYMDHLRRMRRFASTRRARPSRQDDESNLPRDEPPATPLLPPCFPPLSTGHELGSPYLRRISSRKGGILAPQRGLPAHQTK